MVTWRQAMKAADYVELRCRSAFSFLAGASLPEDLVERAAVLGYDALALADVRGVYGAPRFFQAARRAGLRALVGAEVPVAGAGNLWLLVEERAGYKNLCRLLTAGALGRAKGEALVTWAEVEEHAAGLHCLAGGAEGPLAGTDAAPNLARLRAIFDPRLAVDVHRHGERAGERLARCLADLAAAHRVPVVATNDVRHAAPEGRPLLDVLTCIRLGTTLDQAGRRLLANAERHLKAPAEMAALFRDQTCAIRQSRRIAERCAFTLADLGYRFPEFPLAAGETPINHLRALTYGGARDRYRTISPTVRTQLEHELGMIERLDLAGYFLIVWDIVRFCRERGILCQGRGSAANSAVCYALGITAVDPVGMELLFERFLSEERGEWPDIDLDLPSGDQRERAIQYVYERYGKLGAAMTANVITYRGRSAAREIGKALSFDAETLARLASLVGAWEYKDEHDTFERHFHDAGFDIQHPKIRKFFELCVKVQDLPRHLGQHSGGMVVCQGQLDAVVPLEPATMPGRVVVQWDKEDCADMGIVKVDLLGLGMMAVLEDSLKLIREHNAEEVDLARLPADDAVVYDTLRKADTVGMFQIESRAQMACLPRLRPVKFYDIVVQVAIIRPGPIVGKMVHPYLKRRQGREAPECLHPSLEPVLARTLGVPLFQEQLLRMAMIASGFTGGEAEELRRAFGFKRSEKRMKEVEVKLRRGMEKNGITGKVQDTIVKSITSFVLYGFPESHAASFALLAYASAYLKCHYLAAFTAAILNNQPMGFYSPATLVKDAQRHGLRVRAIDVTCSDWLCTIERDGEMLCVRLGLRFVKGLREEVGNEIVRERGVRAFSSIEDLKLRVPGLQKSELTALAEIGALNFVGSKAGFHRRDALWQIERASRRPGPLLERVEESDSAMVEEIGDAAMNGDEQSVAAVREKYSPLAPMTPEARLVSDFRNTGMTVGPHPMSYHRADLRRQGVLSARDLLRVANGTRVRVAGAVIARQRPGTAKGFVFLSLEDETGIANAIIM